jgi:ribonuclease HI
MVAIEIVHFMKSKTRGKMGNVALKLDISKAYDRIDWDYLKDVMVKMGFNQQWINWIMMCVESVDYSVIVNEEMVGPIIPGRGLRQGDPLSPYLFIICAEGLSALIRQAEARGDIHGTKICRNAPIISHLLFADDCFLFFRADEHEAQTMKDILATYEAASGQAISLPKSEIFCSRNVHQGVKNVITNILGVQAVLGTGKYLGLPSMVGRSKKATFNFIKDRVWRKINSWSSKSLSKAGREVLIKSVLQAIPSYVMGIFLIPSTIIDAIEKMMNTFWWGHSGANNKGIHWLSWEKLSVHKNSGGMGFKDLTAFNLAMLGKQGWKIHSNPNCLVSRLFKARYFPHSTFLASSIGHNPSFVWRSISNAKFLVRAGSRWCIGSGDSISILDEPWLSDGACISTTGPNLEYIQNTKLAHLIDHSTKEWNQDIIHTLFDQNIVDSILKTPLIQQVSSDRLVWKAEKNGNYSVKSAYRLCVEELIDTSHLKRPGYWSGIWRLQVPPKVKNLMWRICRGCFPTRARLRGKGILCPPNCVVCDDNYEDTAHILFTCSLSTQVWHATGLWDNIEEAVNSSSNATDTVFLLLQKLNTQENAKLAALIWSLWKHRNLKLWQNKTETCAQIVDRALQLLHDWNQANDSRPRHQNQAYGIAGREENAGAMGSRAASQEIKWTKPRRGRYKCNVDASFATQSNRVGLGMCIRDDEGRFVIAKTMWISPLCNVSLGEALGLFHAINWVRELQLERVDFALDSKIVVDYFNKGGNDMTEFGDVLKECKSRFNLYFQNSSVEFNRRQANAVAHALARVAPSLASSNIFVDVPTCIQYLVMNEML